MKEGGGLQLMVPALILILIIAGMLLGVGLARDPTQTLEAVLAVTLTGGLMLLGFQAGKHDKPWLSLLAFTLVVLLSIGGSYALIHTIAGRI